MAHYPVITEPITDPILAEDSDGAKDGEQLALFTDAELRRI